VVKDLVVRGAQGLVGVLLDSGIALGSSDPGVLLTVLQEVSQPPPIAIYILLAMAMENLQRPRSQISHPSTCLADSV